MSQATAAIANMSRTLFRAAVNAALQALHSKNSGATAPSETYAYMCWADTTTGWLKQRDAANAAWIFRWPLGTAAEADVASATTTDLGASTSNLVRVTGTTTITGFGTADAGRLVKVRHSGALTLTHNGTSLILPGAANITTAAGDTYEAESLGSGNWVVRAYQKASGAAVVASTGKLVQAVAATKTDTFGLASSTFTDVTGLSVTTAAMASSGSKVKISVHLGRVAINTASGFTVAFRLVRDSTSIGIGDAAGSATRSSFVVTVTNANLNYSAGGYSFEWYDSPGDTSTHTYKLQMATESSAQGYINRNYTDDQSATTYASRTASSIIVEEYSS